MVLEATLPRIANRAFILSNRYRPAIFLAVLGHRYRETNTQLRLDII